MSSTASVPVTDSRPYLWVREDFINRTRECRFGDSEPYQTFARTPGELYRAMAREYGRCTGKVYIDLKVPTCPACTSHLHRPAADGPWYCDTCDREIDTPVCTKAIGWVFVSRQRYEDARGKDPGDYYLREVWVTVLDGPDTVVRTQHLHYLD